MAQSYHFQRGLDEHVGRLGAVNVRRLESSLTEDNTHPIKILLDTSQLYAATSLPYTACFKIGGNLSNIHPRIACD
jgi:hypothetical protein